MPFPGFYDNIISFSIQYNKKQKRCAPSFEAGYMPTLKSTCSPETLVNPNHRLCLSGVIYNNGEYFIVTGSYYLIQNFLVTVPL